MELYKDILVRMLRSRLVEVKFTNCTIDPNAAVEMTCYNILKQIKAIIEDDSLEDPECFQKIEEIVKTFEMFGSDGGSRHDF